MAPSQNKTKKSTGPSTFVVDAQIPIRDQLIVGEQFTTNARLQKKYLEENIKVKSAGSVKGKLGEAVKVTLEESKVVVVIENSATAKRQLKYLTRRYLKKQSLSNYLRVVAPKKDTYLIKYLASTNEEADEEEEEEEGVDVE